MFGERSIVIKWNCILLKIKSKFLSPNNWQTSKLTNFIIIIGNKASINKEYLLPLSKWLRYLKGKGTICYIVDIHRFLKIFYFWASCKKWLHNEVIRGRIIKLLMHWWGGSGFNDYVSKTCYYIIQKLKKWLL